jgi:hydroxymethylpyrimidine pyrophosphatase-like HAD family hydrolase
MIIAIDFDGTICRGKYPAIDGLQPYAKDVINRLYDEGHYIIIWTCRRGDCLTEAINFLLEKGVKFSRINDCSPEIVKQYGNNSRKVYAHLYIDDKQVGGLPTWNEIYEYAHQKEEEYHNLNYNNE